MKRLITGMLVVGATCAWGVNAQAQEERAAGRPDAGALFDRLDKNSDGELTADEIDPERGRFFERLLRGAGKDEGESLTRDEFVGSLRQRGPEREGQRGQGRRGGEAGGRMAQLFERLRSFDANRDGKIALDEVPEERREMFERLLDQFDADDDDALSMAEIRQAMQQMAQIAGGRARQRQQPAEAAPEAQAAAETEVAQDQPRRRGPGRSAEGQPGRQRPQRGEGQRPEGPPGPPELGARLLEVLDKDGDGQLSAEEIAGAAEALKQLDRDGDGTISRRELMGRRGGQAGARPQGRPAEPGQFLDRLMQADADGDGKLSKDEAPERLQRRFDDWDTNNDGYLDRDELRAGMAEMMRQRGGQGRPGRPGGRPRSDNNRSE